MNCLQNHPARAKCYIIRAHTHTHISRHAFPLSHAHVKVKPEHSRADDRHLSLWSRLGGILERKKTPQPAYSDTTVIYHTGLALTHCHFHTLFNLHSFKTSAIKCCPTPAL